MSSQGHRLLIFVTTSEASVVKMLGIDKRFAQKVAVPAVSNLQELGAVLHESGFLESSEINAALGHVQQRTGSDRVDVGIKTVLDCVFRARDGGSEVVETFAELLVDKIEELQ